MDKELFKTRLDKDVEDVEKILKELLPKAEGPAATVMEAMDYSVMAGGKRLRPIMILESFRLFSHECDDTIDHKLGCFMAAMEYIHTYSLVHDDLPAMDNDEYRRGRLTTWKMYGDGMGVLAGDALLNYAFEMMMKAAEESVSCHAECATRILKASAILSKKAGIYGMIGGQCADIEAEEKEDVTIGDLMFIHEHKTACLIEAALMVGAVLAGADDEQVKLLERVGSNVGVAFQIRDDLLDVIGNTEKLGKKTGSDAANGKATYVTINGIEPSKEKVLSLSKEAEELLSSLPGDKGFMLALIDSLIGRTY